MFVIIIIIMITIIMREERDVWGLTNIFYF